MRSLEARLEKLEGTTAAPKSRRTFRIVGGSEGESPADFIRSHGQDVDEAADLILHRVIVVPTPNGPRRVDTPMHFADAA